MNRCNIIQSDFKDLLDSLEPSSVDFILTDPPYAISRKTNFHTAEYQKLNSINMDFGEWDQAEIDIAALAKLSYRALREGGTAIVWYGMWKLGALREAFESAGFGKFRQVIWEKDNPVPVNAKATYLSGAREMAMSAIKGGKATFNSDYDTGLYYDHAPRGDSRSHPTQKPLKLFERLITKHSNYDDLVCDPFLGSGTTAVAAVKNHRRFVGGDLSAEYIAGARRRLEATTTRLKI